MKNRRSALDIFVFWPALMVVIALLFYSLAHGVEALSAEALQMIWRVILLNSFVGLLITVLLNYPKIRKYIAHEISVLKAKQEPLWYYLHFGVSGMLVINLLSQMLKFKLH